MSVTHFPEIDEAVASFNDMRVSDATLRAIAAMEITTPTPIQAQAIPVMLDGHDLIGQARTGSGKTLAFAIPAIESIDTRIRGVQAIVLTPTRELAIQVGGVFNQLAAAKGLKVGLIYGGVGLGPQREMLRRGVHAVVGTPGRVLDLLNQGALWLDKVRFLVLDEADEMLDRGFAPDVERILARTTPDRQTALFSATVPDWVRTTAQKHMHQPVTVKVDPNPEDVAPVEHVAYDVYDGDKMRALRDLLDHRGEGSVIVFGRTKHGVKKLAKQLVQAGYPVAALQGNLSQNARDQVMADFRSGAVPILFATNVAARGIDVTDVVAVINVELPESSDLLTHRIGRTGRMGRKGIAITLLGPDDGAKWRQLERGLGRRIPRTTWRGAAAAYAGAPADILESPESLQPARSQRAQTQPRPQRQGTGQARPQSRVQGQAASLPRPQAQPGAPRAAAQSELTAGELMAAAYASRPAQSRPKSTDEQPRAQRPAANGQRHRIECTECGQPAEVRFRPDPTRPVYCDGCFAQRGRHPRRDAVAAASA